MGIRGARGSLQEEKVNHSEHARIRNEGKKAKENRALFGVHTKAAQAAPRVPSLVLASEYGVPGGDPEGL